MIIKVVMLVTSSALFPAIQLAFNKSHFRFNRVDGQRLYLTGFTRTRVDGFQQGIQVGLPNFERVRPARAVLWLLVHFDHPCVVLDCSHLQAVAVWTDF